jgi:hypothetical protein
MQEIMMASPTRSTSLRFNLQVTETVANHDCQGRLSSPPVVMHPPPKQRYIDLLFETLLDSDDDELRTRDETDDYLHVDFIELFDIHGSDRPERPSAWLPYLPPLSRALHELTLANLPVDDMLRRAEEVGKGGDITAVDPQYGRSVLHWAGILAHPTLVGWLLRQGAASQLGLTDHHGHCVIGCVHAFRSLPGTSQVIDHLLSGGAGLDKLPYRGAELLYRKDLTTTVIRKLLAAGVDVDGGGAFESTPLIAGCGSVDWGAASLLLEFEANVLRRGAFGMSVLHNPRLPVWLAEQFLRRGADVNAKDMLGETPLMLACAQGNRPLVRWLISKGARADDVAHDLRTMADYAVIGGPQVTDWLVRHGHLVREAPAKETSIS